MAIDEALGMLQPCVVAVMPGYTIQYNTLFLTCVNISSVNISRQKN